MAKIRKGISDADDRLNARVMLGEFSKLLAKGESLPTPSEMLVELMNGHVLTSESRMRVERIIQLLQSQKEYVSLISTRGREQVKSVTTEAYILTLMDLSRQLNRLLSRYAVIPHIEPFFPAPIHFFLPADTTNCTPADRAEVGAVLSAVQLAHSKQIESVRLCTCGTYFVAGRIDQQYCSVKCRVKAHQSSDEFKAKRRVADRDRYRLHRDGKVKESTGRKHGTQKTR